MNPKQISAAAAALDTAKSTCNKIAEAIRAHDAAGNVADLQDDLQRLRKEQEDIAAAAALGEVDPAEAKLAQSAIEAAQRAVDDAARLASEGAMLANGLRRRLQDAESAVTVAAAELESTENAWLRAEAIAADSAYTEAARAAWKAWSRVAACRGALAVRAFPLDAMGISIQAPELRAAGPKSAAAVMEAHPTEPHGWSGLITPRHEASAGRALIEAELAAMRETSPGMLAKARAAIAKAAA